MANKTMRLDIKCSQEDKDRLKYITGKGRVNESEAVRNCIKFAYQSLKDILEPELEIAPKSQEN